MTVVGLVRAKNAARWIEECLCSLMPACSRVFMLDDHSEDSTAAIAASIPEVHVIRSPFADLNEARDKTFLLSQVKMLASPDWAVMIDADEVLLDAADLLMNIASGKAKAYRLKVLALWDRPDQIRVDGIYADFWRASVFHIPSTTGLWVQRNMAGPNLHCDSVPTELSAGAIRCNPPVRLKHYGPMLREDRIAKYRFYRSVDPDSPAEDNYRHSVLGDLPEFPKDAVYRHGGPLKLAPFVL